MLGNISSLRRQVKNVAYNFSDTQVKVREATSNDPWGPSSSLMSEIADMSYNTMACVEVMEMIWKRLNDHGKNWRHVYKSLVLLDYLIKVGSERVAQQCRENIYSIQTLRDFQHIEENKDQGINVREKAKQLVTLLKDDERLKNERARALMARKRFAQNGMAIGSDGSTHSFGRSDRHHQDYDYESGVAHADGYSVRTRRRSEFEECRPSSVGEEELQLQIAMALSKEEAQKEDEQRKHDDLRLQMAISESRYVDKRHSMDSQMSPMAARPAQSSRHKGSAIDDLLSLQPAFAGSSTNDPFVSPRGVVAEVDPWGMPVASPAAASGLQGTADPWATDSPPLAHLTVSDPWAMDTVRATLPEDENKDLLNSPVSEGRPRALTKTPEHFLGENSALVNLDNLMGPPKPVVPGMPPKSAANNPFVGSGGSSGSGSTANPFAAQHRPSPTLHEIRQGNTQQSNPGSSTTNPFL